MLSKRLLSVAAVCVVVAASSMADKYTDENRPYEFGFNIEGEQHRHEKKDENGIIMGEFGFLTADDVYHVTVYATDENGNFKILSMKNLRLKSPTNDRSSQSRALQLPKSANSGKQFDLTPVQQNSKPLPEAAPIRACSGCSIPTSTQPTRQLSDIARVVTNDQNFAAYPQQAVNPRGRQLISGQSDFNNQNDISNFGGNQQQFGPESNNQFNGGSVFQEENFFQKNLREEQLNQQPGQLRSPVRQPGQTSEQFGSQPGQLGSQISGFNFRGQPSVTAAVAPKPMLISAQMRIVDKNTDIYQRGPGEKTGLPHGLQKDDMLQLLYTFNYTVGFHGHHEDGYANGVKKGYYFVTGRDGVRTRIDYVADSEGFHPKISTEVLDLLSENVPKAETEKEEKYGLKGYEFKWLYFPPNSK